MVRPPAIQNLILQALKGSQNHFRVILATHCSIFMEPAEYRRNIFVSIIDRYDFRHRFEKGVPCIPALLVLLSATTAGLKFI
jgi:hypothetical protein